MIWYEHRGKDDLCVRSESSWDLVKSPFWRKEGWMSTDIQGGRGRRHTSINSNMTFDVALVTLIQNTSLWWQCFAQWKSYKGSSAPLKSETAMSYGAEAPSLQRKSSYKWNGSAHSHNMWRLTMSIKHQGQHRDNPIFQMTLRWHIRVGPWLCWNT